jgi:hypothetical protein
VSAGPACAQKESTSMKAKVTRWLVMIAVAFVALFALYTWIVLNWSYSEGERAGYLQKFSEKGWICKTWEGDLVLVTMPGTASETFPFTVRDEAVAAQLLGLMSKRVSLRYEEHVGVPTSCFGDTRYFVTGVRVVDDPHIVAPVPVPVPTPGVESPGAP